MRLLCRRAAVLAAVMSCLLAIAPIGGLAQVTEQPDIVAERAIVVDASTGDILLDKGANEPVAMASLTKLFTAFVAIESTPLERQMSISDYDLVGEASMGVASGEVLTFQTLLNGMLLPSGNDAATAIARNLGAQAGDSDSQATQRFIDRANTRLATLGLHNTHLERKGLPKEERLPFNDLVAPQGILPNSREAELLRIDHALAVELEEVLRDYPGVQTVKVLVRKNAAAADTGLFNKLSFVGDGRGGSALVDAGGSEQAADRGNQPGRPPGPGATVLTVTEPGASVSEDDIRDIVQRSLSGIPRDQIFVKVVASTPPGNQAETVGVANEHGKIMHLPLRRFLKLWRVPEEDYTGISLTLLACMLLMGSLGALFGHWVSLLQPTRRGPGSDSREIVPRLSRAERPRREIGSTEE